MPTELITVQHLGTDTETALQAYGQRLSDADISAQLEAVQHHHVAYETAYIAAGLMLLARKASLKHGEFGPWIKDLSDKNDKLSFLGKGETGPLRAGQRMMWFARRFLYQLTEVPPVEQTLNGYAASAGFAIVLAGKMAGTDLRGAIGQFVAGRSLDQLRRDLNAAERDAAADTSDEEETIDIPGTDGDEPAPKPAPVTEEQLSLQFYDEEFAPPFHAIEESIKRPEFLRLLQYHPEKLAEAEQILANAHRAVKKLVRKGAA